MSSQVAITLDKQQYASRDTITMTIINHLPDAITVTDHQTNCTIISLQLLTNGSWQTIHNCRIMSATRMIKIAAGSTTTIQLVPGGGQLATTPWTAGTYRATLLYGTGTTPNFGASVTSATFTIS